MNEMAPSKDALMTCSDGRIRCFWPGEFPDYQRYHDEEWGVPVADDRRLFEKICLEGFQCGLSWLTILRKRENFRKAFDNFDFSRIALYDERDIERLMQDKGIVRHRGKIVSVINNARRALELVKEKGSLAAYFWSFEPGSDERPATVDYATLVANSKTATSVRISKDLKRRGWSFVGPTTIYAFMQAMGQVNDHIEGCYCRQHIEILRQAFIRPS
ncbi:DNA-3-methyladenine glycosylase I [Daeguia caeni]|uniref:DNA-3-methyladenine glycosylase I n=1 Tax=Daeguia caeni TaxID=439612 RepID=A0ABV9H7J8_9HYPH